MATTKRKLEPLSAGDAIRLLGAQNYRQVSIGELAGVSQPTVWRCITVPTHEPRVTPEKLTELRRYCAKYRRA